MTDETKEPELQPEQAATEAVTPEPAAAEETGDVVIAIEGEEPELDPEDDAETDAELGVRGLHALKEAREAAKQARAEARELKARLAEKEAAQQVVDEDNIGPMPTYADFNYQDEAAAKAIIEWNEKKRKIDERKAAEQAKLAEREAAFDEKRKVYYETRHKVGVDDDAQARVVAALSDGQQSALMDASENPARVVAALAKTPKVLAELASITEIHKFSYRLAQIEGKITVTTKSPPPPETKLKGGVSSNATNYSSQLDAAEKRAEATGDRTEINRLKMAMRSAGVA